MPRRSNGKHLSEENRLAEAAREIKSRSVHLVEATLWTNNILSPYTIMLTNGVHPFLVLQHHVEILRLYDFPMGIRVEYRFPGEMLWTLSHAEHLIPLNQHSQIHLRLIGADADEATPKKRLALAVKESRFTINGSAARNPLKLFEGLPFDRHVSSCLVIHDPDITAREQDTIFTPVFLSTRPSVEYMAKYYAKPDTLDPQENNISLLLHEAMALATIDHLATKFRDLAFSLDARVYALRAVNASILVPLQGERAFLCHEVFASSWDPITGTEDEIKLTNLQLTTINTCFHFVFKETSSGRRCLEWVRALDSSKAIVIWHAYMGNENDEKRSEDVEAPHDIFAQRHQCTKLCETMGLHPIW